jgi:hypothetical protein
MKGCIRKSQWNQQGGIGVQQKRGMGMENSANEEGVVGLDRATKAEGRINPVKRVSTACFSIGESKK